MEKNIVTKGLKKLNVKVLPNGLVNEKDGNKSYGALTHTGFKMLNRREIPYSEIQSITFSEENNTLQIEYSSGTMEEIYPRELWEPDNFVDIKLLIAPKTISQLNSIFDNLYPDAKEQLYHNELTEKDVIDMTMLGRPDLGIMSMDDKIMSLFYADIEDKLISQGYVGNPPPREVCDHVMNIHTFDNKRNPFREWVESHEWDGVPRLRTWFQETFAATAPPLEVTGQDDQYLGDVAVAWFVGAVRRMYSRARHEIVPVFISDQGIGKGLALQYTAGSNKWFKATVATTDKPKEFLESVRGHIIIELGESKQIRSGDVEVLKAFISEDADQLRAPYAHFEVERPRKFILAATSNLDNVFVDITGNRRFFPMYCDADKIKRIGKYKLRAFSEDRSVGQYDVEQVWAEALYMYKHGATWWLSAKSAEIADVMQTFATQENSNLDIITNWLDNPDNGYDEKGAFITKSEIMENVFHILEGEMHPKELETAYRAWVNHTKSWKKTMVRKDGKTARGYERILLPGEIHKVSRLNIVERQAVSTELSNDPATVIRQLAERYGFRDTGDAVPVADLTEGMIDTLLSEGYIYDAGIKDYRLGYLP